MLREIDWGSDRVYDQTCVQAGMAGLVLEPLAPWDDVDRPEDVMALRRRLATAIASSDEADPTFLELARRMDRMGMTRDLKAHIDD